MKKIIFLFNLFVISAIYGDIYSDRMLVYIDNSVANFQVDESTGRTNLEELNKKLDDLDAEKIKQWLPNARPTEPFACPGCIKTGTFSKTTSPIVTFT